MKEKNNNNNNQNQSTQIIATVLAIAILIVAVVGISFAAFTYSKTGQKENEITTGTITMVYTEGDKGISIENAMPVSDEVGKTFEASDIKGSGTTDAAGVFDFNVNATISGSVTINYDIMAVKKTESTLGEQYAKLYLQKDTSGSDMESAQDATVPTTYSELPEATTAATAAGKALSNAKLLHTDSFESSGTHYYRLKMWVDNSYVVTGAAQTFTVTIDVYGQAA